MISILDFPDQLSAIRTIDISPFLSPASTFNERNNVLDDIRYACSSHGFFSLTGHGIPLQLQNQVLGCVKKFYTLPMQEKLEVSMGRSLGMSNRGYEILQGQTLQHGALPDLKEGFFIGAEVPPTDPRAGKFLHGPNLWLSSLNETEFKEPLMEYLSRLTKIAELLLEMLRQILPGPPPETMFDNFRVDPSTNLRLLHYPPQKSVDERQLGAGAHTDFEGITLLLQQPGAPGLEVWHPETSCWIPVPAKEDQLVVNIGDLLNIWTSGYFLSAVHRVINREPTDRYSVPFFYNGNTACEFRPLDLDGKDKERAVQTVEAHILGKLRATRKKVEGAAIIPVSSLSAAPVVSVG